MIEHFKELKKELVQENQDIFEYQNDKNIKNNEKEVEKEKDVDIEEIEDKDMKENENEKIEKKRKKYSIYELVKL